MAGILPSHAPNDTSRNPERRRIRVLALDGGGVRSLSSLILLRGLMKKVAVANDMSSHDPVAARPSEYFDLIIGTGMGGISALFLGRLRMTVDEAISAYQEVAKLVFHVPSSFSSNFQRPHKLEQCVGNIVQRYLDDRNAILAGPRGGSHTCRTAVLASTSAYVDAPPHIFRSYVTYEPPSTFTIHEVVRAAVAVPGTSLSVSLGHPPIEFINAEAFGYNNPAEVGLSEAEENLHGDVTCLVSLGSGVQKIVQIDGQRNNFNIARKHIASDSEWVHDRMCRSGRIRNMEYFRYNVTRGLEDDIQEWTPSDSSHIAGITEGYMRNHQVAGSLISCAQKLVALTLVAESQEIAQATFRTIIDTLKELTIRFPQLEVMVEVISNIVNVVDKYSQKRGCFQTLTRKLEAIMSIVQHYQKENLMEALETRIKDLTPAIERLKNKVDDLQNHDVLVRLADDTRDGGVIMPIINSLDALVDMFQMNTGLSAEADTELIKAKMIQMEARIEHILQKLDSDDRNLQRLKPAEHASYETRHGAEDDEPHGCMEDTRVQILADLEAWAHNDTTSNVYWLKGQLGTGKTTIAHTLCERLDAQQMLGASLFCSPSGLRDAGRIIPTIAYMLTRYNPKFRSAICEVLARKPDVADLNSLPEQFSSLIVEPVKVATERDNRICNIVVIDAIDECSSPSIVKSLVETILDGVADIPLKIFITSRPETYIQWAFRDHSARLSDIKVSTEISLQEATRGDVRNDIRTYLRTSLSEIAAKDRFSQESSEWPPPQKFSLLLDLSADLFIYAATAVRYIGAINEDYRDRLTDITDLGSTDARPLHTGVIDSLYKHIMDRAFSQTAPRGRSNRRDVLATVVAWLLDLERRDVQVALSPLHSVIHVPDNGHVTIFHASFHEFIVDPDRCQGHSVDYKKGHQMLTVKCLQLLNKSLRRNICKLPEDKIGAHPHEITDPSVTSEALRYSCLHWASHLADSLTDTSGDHGPALYLLSIFADTHLLHWFECLSASRELESGLRSLSKAKEVISKYSSKHAEYGLLFEDAHRCLQMAFEAIKHHCLNTYRSALAWVPTQSRIRQRYIKSFGGVPRVVLGLAESWGPLEHVMQHRGMVYSVAFSPDGNQVVSGSDESIRIWNATTGEIERMLESHSGPVTSVAFSLDGTRILSGSYDHLGRIWNATTGKVERELKGHLWHVTSVAFSLDGKRVVSGSRDRSIRIWNAITGEIEGILEGHLGPVNSVIFSPDGTRVVSGSSDKSIRIWNATTGKTKRILQGHSDWVNSVAFSPDGTRVVSGSSDHSARIWNAITWKLERILEGHSGWVRSVAFLADGTRVVSGSGDNSIRIWNATTGDVEYTLKGHSDAVTSVAFSRDGTRVVSGSWDLSARTWKASAKETESLMDGHTKRVKSVAFSPDGTRVVSSSDDETVRIWDTDTGKSTPLPPYTYCRLPDGSKVTHYPSGEFRFVAPNEPEISVSRDQKWILTDPPSEACWIPPEFREFDEHAFSKSKACFGYTSGRVVIVDLRPVNSG